MAQSLLSVYAELLSMDRTSSSKHLSAGLIRPADVIYNAVENGIEWDLGPIRIATITGLNQLLGFAKSRGVDEDYVLLFGRGGEEVARRGSQGR